MRGVEGDAQPLYALLKDEEAVGATIRALGKWKLVGAIDQITPFANHEKETWRVAVANALRDIGDFKGVPTLLNQLNDSFFTVRQSRCTCFSPSRRRNRWAGDRITKFF